MGIAKAKRMHSDFRTLLRSGYVVMHISWSPQHVPPAIMSGSEDEPSPVAPLPAGVCWLHIGLFYERPIRPTFVAMERDSAFDEDGLLGLQACRHPSHQRELHCMTECEAFGDLLDPEAEEIICKFYCLAARPNRRVGVMSPHRQRVQEIDVPHFDLRSLKKPPRKKRARGKCRGRGRGRGGR